MGLLVASERRCCCEEIVNNVSGFADSFGEELGSGIWRSSCGGGEGARG